MIPAADVNSILSQQQLQWHPHPKTGVKWTFLWTPLSSTLKLDTCINTLSVDKELLKKDNIIFWKDT